MTQLITTPRFTDKEVIAIHSLPSIKQSFILALMDSKIATMEKVNAGNSIYEIVKISEFDSGIGKYDNDDLIVLSKSIYDLIIDRYQTLTITEFKKACKYGVINTYGDWQGMCLKTFNQWIKGYLNAEQRVTAIKEWNAKIAKSETSDVPVKSRIEFSKQSAIKAFEHYKLTKEMPLSPSSYYDVINEFIGIEYKGKKTLITDPETRKKIVAECEELHTKMAMGLKKKSETNGHFNEAEKLIEVIIDPKGQKTLERMIKAAFLKQYFNQLIESGKEMEL